MKNKQSYYDAQELAVKQALMASVGRLMTPDTAHEVYNDIVEQMRNSPLAWAFAVQPTQMMTPIPVGSISELERGDIVRHDPTGDSFVVDTVGGTPEKPIALASKVMHITNPREWLVMKRGTCPDLEVGNGTEQDGGTGE